MHYRIAFDLPTVRPLGLPGYTWSFSAVSKHKSTCSYTRIDLVLIAFDLPTVRPLGLPG